MSEIKVPPCLTDIQKFFQLPVHDGEQLPTPILSRHQPTGFMDKDGVWTAVLVEGEFYRQLWGANR